MVLLHRLEEITATDIEEQRLSVAPFSIVISVFGIQLLICFFSPTGADALSWLPTITVLVSAVRGLAFRPGAWKCSILHFT